MEEAWKKLIYQKYREMNRKCDYEAERVAYNVGLLRLAQSQVRNPLQKEHSALNMSFFEGKLLWDGHDQVFLELWHIHNVFVWILTRAIADRIEQLQRQRG